MKRLRDDVEKTKKQITKAKVLADKFGGKENAEETVEKSAPPNSNGELIAENAKLAKANEGLSQKVGWSQVAYLLDFYLRYAGLHVAFFDSC